MIKSNGHIISGTSICVDFWCLTPEATKKYHHFLTHLHADHTVNLTSAFCEPIYTSSFNAWLLRRWFNIDPEYIVAMDVGESQLVYDEQSKTCFSVTLLEANHCPGSVMFLFQGSFGNILYTGDFRYHPKIFENPMLKSLIENEAVDRLYLDNTFAAEHCEFPARSEALKDVISVIKAHPDHNIVLGVRKLGKEEVLRAVALEMKEKVHVSEDRLRILTKLGYEGVFTPEKRDCRIFVKEIPHITRKYIDQLRAERGPVVTILLTALYSVSSSQDKNLKINTDVDRGVHKIPYSDHSCHSELVEFVSRIKPKQILPIVTNDEVDKVKKYDEFEILSCYWQNIIIPKSIMKFTTNSNSCGNIIKPRATSGFKNSCETTCGNIIKNLKKNKALKTDMLGNCEEERSKGENTKRVENVSAEIIKRILPLKECRSQSKELESKGLQNHEKFTENGCYQDNLITLQSKEGDVDDTGQVNNQLENCEEWNWTDCELGESSLNMKNVQTLPGDTVNPQSTNVSSAMIYNFQPLKNKENEENPVEFPHIVLPPTSNQNFKKPISTKVPKRKPIKNCDDGKESSICEHSDAYNEVSDTGEEEPYLQQKVHCNRENNCLHPTKNSDSDILFCCVSASSTLKNLLSKGKFNDKIMSVNQLGELTLNDLNQFNEVEIKSYVKSCLVDRIFKPLTSIENINLCSESCKISPEISVRPPSTSIEEFDDDEDEKHKYKIRSLIVDKILPYRSIVTRKESEINQSNTNVLLLGKKVYNPENTIKNVSASNNRAKFGDKRKNLNKKNSTLDIVESPPPNRNISNDDFLPLSVHDISEDKILKSFEILDRRNDETLNSKNLPRPTGIDDDFLPLSNSSGSDASYKDIEKNIKKQKEIVFDHSNSSESDLDDDQVLHFFEILDRRNEKTFNSEIKERKRKTSCNSIESRISKKFKHLLVKKFSEKYPA